MFFPAFLIISSNSIWISNKILIFISKDEDENFLAASSKSLISVGILVFNWSKIDTKLSLRHLGFKRFFFSLQLMVVSVISSIICEVSSQI